MQNLTMLNKNEKFKDKIHIPAIAKDTSELY